MRQPQPFFRNQTQSWYVQLGKQQINLGKDEDKAREKYHELMLQHERRVAIADDTVRGILRAYWKWLKKNRAATTAKTRKPILESFARAEGKRKVWQLKPYHVQQWCSEKYGKKSSTYQYIATSTVCYAFGWAAKAGLIDRSPLRGMEKPTANIRQEFLPVDQWPKLLAAPKDEAFRDWLKVMLLSGARVQEMFRFEARYFEARESRIILPIKESKGRKKSRVIYLPDEAAKIVAKWAAEYPTGRMFRNTRGKPWNKNSINCRFKRLKKVMGNPKLNATVLRHSFAAHRLAEGQDSLLVSKLLGHVDGRMLATRYGHLDQQTGVMKKAANAIPSPLVQQPLP